MAGVGGYPPVIYLPKDTRWEEFGKGLGDMANQIFDAWNTADATKKAEKIPDIEHRMIYLRSRLGEKGDKYIDDQIRFMDAKEKTARSAAEIEHWHQQDKYRETQDQINNIILQNEQRRLDAEIAAKEHRANSVRSAAGGSGAKADQQEAAAKHSDAETEKLKLQIQQMKEGQERLNSYFRQQGKGPAATVPPTAPVRPQSYEVPQPDQTNGLTGGATVKPIVASDIVTPAVSEGGTTIDPKRPVGTVPGIEGPTAAGEVPKDLSLDQIESLRKMSASGTQLLTEVPGVTEETINQASAEIGAGKEGEAWKAIKEAKAPKDVKMENIGGGFQAYTGLYEDGKRRIVPGSRVEDKRKPMDVQEQRAEQNVVLWDASNRIMRQLSDQSNVPVGKGGLDTFLNSAAGRAANAWLYRNMGQTLTPEAPRYLAQYALARTSLDSMMAGLRETDRYRQLLDTTQPGYADSPSVRRAKFDTMEMTADLMIKERMEDAMRNGKQYGSGMAELYKNRGLDKMSVGDITQKYMEGSRKSDSKPAATSGRDSGSGSGKGTVIKTPQGNVTIEPD